MEDTRFFTLAHEALSAECNRLCRFTDGLDQAPAEKKKQMAEYKCAKYRSASVNSIFRMLYHGNRVYRRPAVHLDIENSLNARPDYLALCNASPAEELIDHKLYYGISAHIEEKLAEHEARAVHASDWEKIELEERIDGLQFAKVCLDEAWQKRKE